MCIQEMNMIIEQLKLGVCLCHSAARNKDEDPINNAHASCITHVQLKNYLHLVSSSKIQ